VAEQAAVVWPSLARGFVFAGGNWADRGEAARHAPKQVASRKGRINLPLVCVWDIFVVADAVYRIEEWPVRKAK
jgi:hypothetical protein